MTKKDVIAGYTLNNQWTDVSLTIKGKPISISTYIKGMNEHENHHKDQIQGFLKGNK